MAGLPAAVRAHHTREEVMSGPLPEYRALTRVTDEPKVKVHKNGLITPVTRLVIDKVLPPRKGERPTYTHKEVPVYRHKFIAKPERPSKHANGKVMSTPLYKAHQAFVARIQKKVK